VQIQRASDADASWRIFSSGAGKFVKNTDRYVRRDMNPGDYYRAVWCRDASYILKDWFLAGDVGDVMQAIHFIWSHQIAPGKEKIVYGRGSPDMNFLSQVADRKEEKEFEGALPTTIFGDFSEVYAKNPDIDSTALMVSTTSWVLDNYLKTGSPDQNAVRPRARKRTKRKLGASPEETIDFTVPRMLKAVGYLRGRDLDNDSLLEQDHNEDWMDTVLRAGKIVYSQACWILALTNLSFLLSQLGKKDKAGQVAELANKTIHAVEEHLWSDEEGCYIDKQASHHLGREYRTLTQDVSLYLVAVTENTAIDILSRQLKGGAGQQEKVLPEFANRGNRTLDAIKSRIWKDRWPLVTETELVKTGPWVLHPNQYHNHTFWPWTTGIEMLARSRFKRFEECDILLSHLIRGRYPDILAFHEWVDPSTGRGSGAFPFRTGISAIRIAITDILTSVNQPPRRQTHLKNRGK
jgi:hypothetical protein